MWRMMDRRLFDPAFAAPLSAALEHFGLAPVQRVLHGWGHNGGELDAKLARLPVTRCRPVVFTPGRYTLTTAPQAGSVRLFIAAATGALGRWGDAGASHDKAA